MSTQIMTGVKCTLTMVSSYLGPFLQDSNNCPVHQTCCSPPLAPIFITSGCEVPINCLKVIRSFIVDHLNGSRNRSLPIHKQVVNV